MSATIPVSLFKDFVVFVEKRIQFVNNREEVGAAVSEIKIKAKEVERTATLNAVEEAVIRSNEAPQSPGVDQPPQDNGTKSSQDPSPTNEQIDTTDVIITVPIPQQPSKKERQVKRRRKRVSHKITKEVADEDSQPQDLPDFSNNTDLKYLTTELSRRPNNEDRVHVYMRYLACCRFNTTFSPGAVITFSEEDAESLGTWAASQTRENQSINGIPKVVGKLYSAMEQRLQLASQQAKEIGQLIMEAESIFKNTTDATGIRLRQGRPTSRNICEVLAEHEHSFVSEAALRETTYVAMTMAKFPMLSFANEPVSHFASATVRSSVQLLADALQESFSVPQSIASAYQIISPYVLNVAELGSTSLSTPVALDMILPNDGDGLVELVVHPNEPRSLQNAIYHRLFAVDAPELYSVSFINTSQASRKQRNGHLSHLAVHYYISSFVTPRGSAVLCKENPRYGETPKDKYQRSISSFWFAWHKAPNTTELTLIDEILASLEGQEDCVRSRILSGINPRNADTDNPFLVNLNALLVLSGFCHVYTKYSPDASLLQLQKVARDNHFGSIWSGLKKNFVLGAKQEDFSSVDEDIKPVAGFDHSWAERMGFPLRFKDGAHVIRFQPWHERECKRELEYATRLQFRDHQNRATKLPYGFVIDMSAESSQEMECSYQTVQTGEAFLQIRPSLVVGIGGESTGLGLFTLKAIPSGTWITSYAPTAPMRLGQNHSHSDYILTTIRNGSQVEIDGKLCPLGLGKYIQDGSFPFVLALEKFSALVKQRVNCQWAYRDGEIWFKTTRAVLTGEELLTRYSHDNSYWMNQMSKEVLQSLRQALLSSPTGSLSDGERVLKNFSFSC